MMKNEQSLKHLWDSTSIHIVEIPGEERILEEIIAENFLKLMKKTKYKYAKSSRKPRG